MVVAQANFRLPPQFWRSAKQFATESQRTMSLRLVATKRKLNEIEAKRLY
jgi:hypothetical protein